jgi:hypothetical protein
MNWSVCSEEPSTGMAEAVVARSRIGLRSTRLGHLAEALDNLRVAGLTSGCPRGRGAKAF